MFEFNSSKSKVDSVDSHDDSNYLILTVVYLSLIVLFCSIGYIGTLKNSYWIIVIFAVGLSIIFLTSFSGFLVFNSDILSYVSIIPTIISACFLAIIVRKQNRKSNKANSNSQDSERSTTIISTTTSVATSRHENAEQPPNGQISSIRGPSCVGLCNGCSSFVYSERPPPYHAHTQVQVDNVNSPVQFDVTLQDQTFNRYLQASDHLHSEHQAINGHIQYKAYI